MADEEVHPVQHFSTWKRGCHCRATLRDDDEILEFRNVPINSWIPLLLLSVGCLAFGTILARLAFQQFWYITLVVWVFSGLFLAKVKYEKYTFDKTQGCVEILTIALTGRFTKRLPLDEIADIELERTRDAQGGDDVELFIKLANGRRLKLLGGQFCGVQTGKLKSRLRKKLLAFLQNVPRKPVGGVPKEATIRPSMQVERTGSMQSLSPRKSSINISTGGSPTGGSNPAPPVPTVITTSPPPTNTEFRVQETDPTRLSVQKQSAPTSTRPSDEVMVALDLDD